MEHPGAPARIPLSRLPGPGKGRRRQSLPLGSSTAGTCRERHGTGPPGGLPGRPCRDGTIPFPASRGHAALAPALPDGRTTGLSGHGAQVIGLVRERCAGGVIPAGDSYGGMVITGAAPAVPERVSHRVYLDAALPDPGRSLLELFLSAGCDLATVPGRKQAKSYVERIGFDPKRTAGIPRACISCTKSDYPLLTLIVRKKIAAAPEKGHASNCRCPMPRWLIFRAASGRYWCRLQNGCPDPDPPG
ncbi:MAG: hypothetical protein ACQXXC_03350 [Methanolinea tarda]|jgi:pimeloyl-ACP methyl ester carboxylesterase